MLTGLKFPPGFLVLCAIIVKARSFQQSKPAGGQDWHFNVHCSSHIPLNQPSAFPSQQSLSTSLFIYLVTGTLGWVSLSMKTILTQSRFGSLFVLNHKQKSNTFSLEEDCQMDEKGLQVFLLVALSIYGQLFPAQNPKSALNQPGVNQSNSIDFRQLFWIQSIVRQNRIWPILSFFVLPAPWIFLFLEDLSVDTKQMTVDNLFDVVNKSKVTAKPADRVRKKRNMNTVGRRTLRKNLNLLLILVVKSKNNQEYCPK